MSKKEKTLEERVYERFSKEEIEKLKKEFSPRQLNFIIVEDKILMLKPIGSEQLATYSMMIATEDVGLVSATKYLLNELTLAGDSDLIDNEEYFMSAMLQTQKIMEVKKSSFLKL